LTAENLEGSLAGHFSTLEDPRDASKRRHKLIDMVVIAIAAVICGADDWVGVAAFGRAKETWFRQFFGAAQRHPRPRHLRAGLLVAGAWGVRAVLSGLGGLDSAGVAGRDRGH